MSKDAQRPDLKPNHATCLRRAKQARACRCAIRMRCAVQARRTFARTARRHPPLASRQAQVLASPARLESTHGPHGQYVHSPTIHRRYGPAFLQIFTWFHELNSPKVRRLPEPPEVTAPRIAYLSPSDSVCTSPVSASLLRWCNPIDYRPRLSNPPDVYTVHIKPCSTARSPGSKTRSAR